MVFLVLRYRSSCKFLLDITVHVNDFSFLLSWIMYHLYITHEFSFLMTF